MSFAHLECVAMYLGMVDGPMYYEIDVNEQDPFVMMAWRCTKLTDVSIIGGYFFTDNLKI